MIETTTGFLQENSDQIWTHLARFFSEPFTNHDSIWIIIPLLIIILIMELYWAYYKQEETGWDTVTSNGLALVFVAMNLLHFLSDNGTLTLSFGSNGAAKTVLILLVLIIGTFMLFLNFFRLWPKFFANKITSVFSVNLIAYMLVIIVYSSVSLTKSLFVASVIFFLGLNLIFYLIRKMFPSYY